MNVHWKDWWWSWSSSTLATWCEEPTLEKTLILGKIERGKGEDRGWDGWMASLTQWTWVWASSGSWWCTRGPDLLQSIGSQSETTERLNWTEHLLLPFLSHLGNYTFSLICSSKFHVQSVQFSSVAHRVWLFAKVLEFQIQHRSFQRNPRVDLLQNVLVGSPCNQRDSQESSPTPQFKCINSSALSLLHSPTLTSIHDHRKNHSLD